jgi:hypothetical protein
MPPARRGHSDQADILFTIIVRSLKKAAAAAAEQK